MLRNEVILPFYNAMLRSGQLEQLQLPGFPRVTDRSRLKNIHEWLAAGYEIRGFSLPMRILQRGSEGLDVIGMLIESAQFIERASVVLVEPEQIAFGKFPQRGRVVLRENLLKNLQPIEAMHRPRGWSSKRTRAMITRMETKEGSVHLPVMLFQRGMNPDHVARQYAPYYPGYVMDTGGEYIQFWGSQMLTEKGLRQFHDFTEQKFPGHNHKYLQSLRDHGYGVVIPIRAEPMNYVTPEVIRIISSPS